MMYSIEVEELTKNFGKITAVDHISFKVGDGEIFGFLGPNGAGKTTTVRILTGVLRPDGGEAYVMGFNILKDFMGAKELMGIVPEVSNVYIDLTVWENLMLIGKLYGVPRGKREEKAESLLKQLDLYDRRKQKAKKLSKGLRQRLILCMALVNEPKILFLDEPMSGLDVISARMIKGIIRKLNRDGNITVFLSTHNMEEANQLCDRIAIINKGRIIAIDTPENLRLKATKVKIVKVSFNKPVNLMKLGLSGKIELIGEHNYKIHTDKPDEVAMKILKFTRGERVKIISLNISPPSLEEVFVKLIGGG